MKNTVQPPKLFYKGLAVFSLLTATACSSFDTGLEKRMTCPPVMVLQDSDKMVRFDGAPISKNMLFSGQIQGVTGECRLMDGTLHVQLTLEAYLRMGLKADPATEYKSPFYVTITDGKDTVLQRVTLDLKNKWNGRVGTVSQRAIVKIPMNNPNDALGYRIYVGYNVTPKELEYIRKSKN